MTSKRMSKHVATILTTALMMAVACEAADTAIASADVKKESAGDTAVQDKAPRPVMLLAAGGLWRKHYTFSTPMLSVKAAKELGINPEDERLRFKTLLKALPPSQRKHGIKSVRYDPPEAVWFKPGFADHGWLQRPGIDLTKGSYSKLRPSVPPEQARRGDGFVLQVGHIAMRGRFIIKDRSQVKRLRLRVAYRGGYVAWLNGKEIARGHLPAGTITPRTSAEECLANATSERASNAIAIDAALLKDGVNVLALGLHRSDYPAAYVKLKKRPSLAAAIGLAKLFLEADTLADNVVSSAHPTREAHVFNADTWSTVFDTQVGDPAEPLAPVRIAAARNGEFSGQVVLSSPEALVGLTAEVSALKGPGEIAVGNTVVRFATANPQHRGKYFSRYNGVGGRRYDMLFDKAPAKVDVLRLGKLPGRNLVRKALGLAEEPAQRATQPVWVSVRVPREAKAGTYRGTLTLKGTGSKALAVPVELDVADWTLPDIKDRGGLPFIYQSPESLCQQYKVERWSDAHWKLIERSLKLMGEAGNIGLIFPITAETCHGNTEGWVRWVKQKDGYKYDYTVFDRYLETALKYHDPSRIKVVAINVWGYENRPKGGKPYGSKVTVLDPESGTCSNVKAPLLGTPEALAFWRPVILAIRDRLKAKGLAERMMFGQGGDCTPEPSQVGMFDAILPGTLWFRDSHFNVNAYKGEYLGKKSVVPVGCNSIVWGGKVFDPAKKRLYGWKVNPRHIVLSFNRYGVCALWLKGFSHPWSFRMWMETTLVSGRNGVGRVGGDFFQTSIDVRKRWKEAEKEGHHRVPRFSGGGSGGTLYGAHPFSTVAHIGLGNNTTDLFGPGPDGPVRTIRFENARLGFQEAEARVFIEKAIVAKSIPEELAKECQKVLDDRAYAFQTWPVSAKPLGRDAGRQIPFGAVNWHESTRDLFRLAAKVEKARK